jgi:TRAP-type mannitol/chloroaromatic compound transport system permease small subunit
VPTPCSPAATCSRTAATSTSISCTRAAVDVLTSVLFFLFAGALLYFGVSLALESMETWERSQSAWNPYIWPFKLAIPVSAALLLLQGVVKLLADLLVLLGREPPPGPTGAGSGGA